MDLKQIAKWKGQVAALNKERASLLQGAASRTPQAFTDTEKTRVEAIKAEIAGLAELIEAGEASIESERAAAGREIERDGDASSLARAAAAAGAEGVHTATGLRFNPFRSRARNPFGVDPLLTEAIPVGEESFRGIGDLLRAEAFTAMAALGNTNFQADPRMLRLQAARTGTQAAGAGVDTGTPSTGGVFVQVMVMAQLLARAWNEGRILSRCRTIPVGAGFDGLSMPSLEENDRTKGKRYGGVQLYWEGDPVPDVNPNAEPREIRLRSLRGYLLIPERTMRDASVLASYFLDSFPKAYTFEAEDMIYRGKGNGRPLGILDDLNAGKVVVPKEGGQAVDTIKAENLVKMRGRHLDISNAAFYVNAEVDEQLMLAYLPTGASSGQLVYMPPTGLSTEPYGTIFGRPIIPVEQASALGDVGDIALLDLYEYLVAISAGGLEQAESMHFAFDVFKRAFRFEMRFNGEPHLKKPVTPAYGTKTRSPFVLLEAR